MLKHEWKKLLFKRQGLWIIVAVLVFEFLGMVLFTQPYDKVLEENREVYEQYLAPVNGLLNQEKRNSIEAEMERLNSIHREVEQLKNDYYSGKVSEAEYRQAFDLLVADDEKFVGFSKLYSQYIFVREQSNRSFLYTGGWELLLTDQEPDYLFLLLLVIVLSPIFCEEYASRMHEILMTQSRSARSQVRTKVAVALMLTVALVAVVQVGDLVYCAVRFGLPNGDYSVQSLVSFGTAEKKLTLWQAFWMQFALKELGFLYAAILILFLSVCFKKYAFTLMAGIASLALPFLTVESNDVFLRWPAPWALSLGSIYLNSSKTHKDGQTGELITDVAELSFGEIGLLVSSVIVIAALILLYIWQKNTNYQIRKRKPGKVVMLLCTTALLMTGCGETKAPIIYNASTAEFCETDDYVLLNLWTGSVFIDKNANVWYPFPLDAAAEDTESVDSNFYCADGNIYYVRGRRLLPVAGADNSFSEHYVLAQLDAKTFSESVRFQWDTERDWFFGLLEKESTQTIPYMVNTFFIHGNDLYYEDQSEKVWCRMDLTTGNWKKALNPNGLSVAYDGENAYYTDEYNRLVIQNLDSGDKTVMEKIVTERFLLTHEGIFFLNRRDNNALYYWNAEKDCEIKLDDTVAYDLYYDSEYLWIVSRTDNKLYRVKHDGTERTAVESPGVLYCVGESLYFQDVDTDMIYIMDKDSLEYQKVEKCA